MKNVGKTKEKGNHFVNALNHQTTFSFSHAAKVHFQQQTSRHRYSDHHVESWKQSLQLWEM